MTKNSIFSRSRFEHEGSHLYYLEDRKIEMLEDHCAIVIHGSRGTGKTTLLNALNWREQITNPYLKEMVGEKKLSNKYLGIYLKLPKINIGSFAGWRKSGDTIYAQLFALYLDFVWLEQLSKAIGTLASDGHIVVSAAAERSVCESIRNYSGFLFEHLGLKPDSIGLHDLARIFKGLRESLEQAATYGESASDIHRRLAMAGQVGEYGREVAKILHELWSHQGHNDYVFKICMDECECLDSFQIKVLSTMVRLGGHPVFFVFSFISFPPNFYSTLIPNIYLGRPDIANLPLDEMSDADFERFAQGVVNVRLKASGLKSINFSNEALFGKLNLNNLIEKILKSSESKKANDFLIDTQTINSPFYEYYKNEGFPYYQSYLVEKLKIDINAAEAEKWPKARRVQESKEVRKKMVAAYLSICNDFSVPPIYAGSEMVFQLSDKSIRDYLSQLHELFVEFGKDTEKFVSSHIPIDTQNSALKRASANKMKTLPSAPLASPAKIYRIVYGLGSLTSLIQRASTDFSHLKSSERGIFTLTKSEAGSTVDLIDLIVEAAEAGFLKITFNDANKLTFRVHTSLAPMFGFSYRGAYYETQINPRFIESLKNANDQFSLEKTIRGFAESSFRIDTKQLQLDGI